MSDEAKKKGLPTGAKWGIGCGLGCLVMVIIIAIVAVLGFRYAQRQLNNMTSQLTGLGFEKVVKGQTLEIHNDITEPTLYMGQMVKIMGHCTTNLAIVAQMAEIHGRVDGKVYFRGQLLVIEPTAEVGNGLDVVAQVLQQRGRVSGEITGTYQPVDNKAAP